MSQKSPSQDGTKSLFDETLIVITSEFSREINLNSSSVETGGKEHNGYTNSYLLMSGGLRGGFTIGESTIQPNILHRPVAHIARNFDFDSGQAIHKLSDAPERMADPKAIKQIRPGHVVRSVAALMGFEGLLDPTLRIAQAEVFIVDGDIQSYFFSFKTAFASHFFCFGELRLSR
ncbi:MAG: DUF1501 domain-containing protein [Bdellovibrionales bacterium]|nr:DUF1501 domain-containing protein [Bdellovibrionales bacterium]